MKPLEVPEDYNTSHSYLKGNMCEELLSDELINAGFVIVARNFKAKDKEVDLIALEGNTLCFIEVKARRSYALLKDPDILINERKRRDMRSVASHFMRIQKGLAYDEIRFDVALVYVPPTGESVRIRYYRNAFLPADRGFF